MRVGECCNRAVCTARPDTGIEEAARLMRQHRTACLVVVSGSNGARHPVGIVSDHDLVLEVLAAGADPAQLTLGDILHDEVLTAHVNDGLWETLERMRSRGVCRLPVVDGDNMLQGILSADDIHQVLIESQYSLMRVVRRDEQVEHGGRPSARTRQAGAAGKDWQGVAADAQRSIAEAALAAKPVAEWLRDLRGEPVLLTQDSAR